MPADDADPFNLQRFVDAQDPVYEQVRAELAAGSKRTHWMWFVFPQIAGLGSNHRAQRYAISSCAEAAAYLAHAVLGARLRECTRLVTATSGRSIHDIFGSPDDMKFHSSMTLFAQATPDNQDFLAALDKYFAGKLDPATPPERILKRAASSASAKRKKTLNEPSQSQLHAPRHSRASHASISAPGSGAPDLAISIRRRRR